MAKVVLVGYGQMLYSLIEGVLASDNKIVGVFRNDRIKYNKFELFFKDVFNPSQDYTNIKYNKLYDIKGDSVNSLEFQNEIKKLKPDLIIVGSWGEKFKSDILNLVTCVNFHPALLPKNRGANPYFWVIYNNQKVTGLTIHFMSEKFDCGDIILQEAITIEENETGKTLKDKTVKLAKYMVQDFLKLYNSNQIQPIKQNNAYASYEPQISEKDIIIDLTKSKTDVERHLRALYPWASPYVKIASRYIKIEKYEFLKVDEKSEKEKTYKILENNNKFFVVKGKDFLFKVYK